MLSCAKSEKQEKMYTTLFSNELENLVKHPLANHAVQRMFSFWKSKENVSYIF